MADNNIITSDQRSGRISPAQRPGLWYNWGPQAWIDMWMSNTMLVKKASLLVTHTFLPILRLSGDATQVDADWGALKSKRETVRLLDSPREKWRKRYGNFVREVEWALLELRKYYSPTQFDEIVIGSAVATGQETMGDFLAMMNTMPEKNKNKKTKKKANGSTEPGWFSTFMFETFNPAHWLTGRATITEFDPSNGATVMHIPDCAWHTCGRQADLPNPNALPEEGCLAICKGPFEAIFKGENGGLKMEFDPHLPETSCTVRMSWSTD
ncbi:hypothetical protein A3709_13705 [Halioglobus sp. HI00S01]|uniref:hypothetical protein n=1 Tax=Halioglobus sp. HI00S01 TaxID=1822214 RepID=UPI0007C3C27A|nr:hypothetical protein [Halioglobus sp. HI00S01]KZX59349.1 hypothetical protein A3709_13705 [Halioglobus sp. HI00S01]